jgi:hypothetical protein
MKTKDTYYENSIRIIVFVLTILSRHRNRESIERQDSLRARKAKTECEFECEFESECGVWSVECESEVWLNPTPKIEVLKRPA